MVLKTATLTFHAAHNYGSVLQSFALQHLIQGLGCTNQILNLRTDRQKKLYRHPKDNRNAGWKSKYIGGTIRSFFKKDLTKKYNYFEEFINNDLNISTELKSTEEVIAYSKHNLFDYFIVGSDQIWNTACSDFDWSFYLPFADNNAIAYACSMGPHGMEQVATENYSKIKECLSQFTGISVREEGTADVIQQIIGEKPLVLLDPTLLLTSEDWTKTGHLDKKPLIKGDYIFLYTPGYDKDSYKAAKKLARATKMQVVVSNLHIGSLLSYHSFNLHLDCGPWQFLNLIKNAKVVVSASFHAVAFSIVFRTPFFAVNGDKDNRLNNILNLMGLSKQTVSIDNILNETSLIDNIDWSRIDSIVAEEKARSVRYLKKSLNLI